MKLGIFQKASRDPSKEKLIFPQADHYKEMCLKETEGNVWSCTRKAGHEGPHEAAYSCDTMCIARWFDGRYTGTWDKEADIQEKMF